MTLAEIREADAEGEIADAYARLRHALGVPVVNFIWRHLATIDGGLAFALPLVEQARPAIDAALPQVRREADALIARHALSVGTGRTIAMPPTVRDVIAVYDRGNSWNFLSMAVLAAARAGGDAAPIASVGAEPSKTLASTPPMLRYDDLAPALQQTIDRLATVGPAAASGVRPSLWVHLSLWPDDFVAIAPACADLLASSAFAQAYVAFQSRGPALLGLDAPPPAAKAPAGEQPIDRAIRLFRMRIAEMVLVGRVLLRQDA